MLEQFKYSPTQMHMLVMVVCLPGIVSIFRPFLSLVVSFSECLLKMLIVSTDQPFFSDHQLSSLIPTHHTRMHARIHTYQCISILEAVFAKIYLELLISYHIP